MSRLNGHSMTRLFAFGCSFTNNNLWPTWADILGRGFDYYKNWGKAGAGNSFIFYSLIECIKREHISNTDVVMVMWTSIAREDRYIRNRKWITPGSIYNQEIYNSNFVEQFADPTGYLIRDMAHIAAARQILQSIGCRFYFLTTVPLAMYDDNIDSRFSIDNRIINLYKEEIDILKPSVYSVVFNEDWYSRPGFVDNEELKRQYTICAGSSWPSWDKFINSDFTHIPAAIKKEIEEQEFTKKLMIRSDTHPLPTEHLIYIDKILPEMSVSIDTKVLVEITTEQILQHRPLEKWWVKNRSPERF